MSRRNFFLPLLALGMVVLFALILVQLLLLRYERGDVYPAYSTLRADPLGTRAFYEALEVTGRYKVNRGFSSLHRELEGRPDMLFYLGLSTYQIPFFTKDEIAELDDYVKNGGRVLITFVPEAPYTLDSDETKTADKKKPATPPKEDKNPSTKSSDGDSNSAEPQTQQEKYEREQQRKEYEDDDNSDDQKDQNPPEYHRSLAALWGFGWELHSNPENKKTGSDTSYASDDDATPPEVFAYRTIFSGVELNVPWKSALYFVRLERDWSPLYYAKGKPVMVRRHWGKGEIVLASDSYFISNEALRNDRCSLLLSFLAGWPGQLTFDESHLGTQEQEGIMALAEKFRLEGYLYGMIGVLMLFLWRNSVPLVPPRENDHRLPLGRTISGKDSRSGLVNLLRRNIPSSEILKVCLTEWKRGVTPRRPRLASQLAEMETIVTATTDHSDLIVQSYHDLSKLNAPGKNRETHATKS